MSINNTYAQIYAKFVNGDSLDTDDINQGIVFYGGLADALALAGPVFRLAALEARRVHRALTDFKEARNRR